MGTLMVLSIALLADIRMINRSFLVAFWVSTTLITLLSRLIIRLALKRIRKQGRNLRNLVIVGTNARAVQFAEKVESRTELGYRLLGFVDSTWGKINEFKKSGRALIASLTEFPDFLRTQAVDEVIVCLPFKSCYQQASQIVDLCEKQGILVRFLSDLFDSKGARMNSETFEGTPVITIAGGKLDGWGVLFKRSFDFSVSLILIILLSPLFLITALLIKAGSTGPAFFRQERLGLNKRRILVYKFRTMVRDADKKQAELEALNEAEGPVFKIKNDPRITSLGKLLRKTSIDELPQLLNVLKGEMSLVGPRPLPIRDFEGFDEDWHRRRFSVRPGLTCLWQVNGRSNTSFDKWMKLDMAYIDNWSIWLDLKILALTIPAVLRGSGAV